MIGAAPSLRALSESFVRKLATGDCNGHAGAFSIPRGRGRGSFSEEDGEGDNEGREGGNKLAKLKCQRGDREGEGGGSCVLVRMGRRREEGGLPTREETDGDNAEREGREGDVFRAGKGKGWSRRKGQATVGMGVWWCLSSRQERVGRSRSAEANEADGVGRGGLLTNRGTDGEGEREKVGERVGTSEAADRDGWPTFDGLTRNKRRREC